MPLYPSLVLQLEQQHHSIPFLIAGLDKTVLTSTPQPGKWSIADNIAHLARYQQFFMERMQQVLQAKEPVFEPYVADNDPAFPPWRQLDIETVLQRLENDRSKLVSTITQLNDTQLELCGTHKKFGRLNIIQWTEFFLLHEAHHLFTIFRIAHDAGPSILKP